MSDTVSYIHAFITLIFCALCKSTCASLLYEITCDIRK
ncbi:amino acid permease, partial [Salmonella enterica]|nr:amino acid permease [Salmonella enterica subsp. enterica]EAO9842106.1 amino acid permease [Salmonella enterica subsp. enterica serovar Weltevreden]EAQ8412869.1 amino acid permease [Salmonella enterica subsp. enterica serovar Johannesburg]EBG1318941.1 amino acid permease [Salmonella enterica]EBI0306431.1 amino acid permease [Salmonella enterica]